MYLQLQGVACIEIDVVTLPDPRTKKYVSTFTMKNYGYVGDPWT